MKSISIFFLIATIAAVIVGGVWLVYTYTKPLEHGTSIVFEFELPSDKLPELKARLDESKKLLDSADSVAEQQALQESFELNLLKLTLTKQAAASEDSLALEMIQVLKDRIAALGSGRFEWSPVGKNRLEVRMPTLPPETQKAKDAYLSAIRAVESRNIEKSDLRKLEKGQTTIAKLAANDKELAGLLDEFMSCFEKMKTADDTNKQQRISNWEQTEERILKRNVRIELLKSILSRYVGRADIASLNLKPKAMVDLQRRRQGYETAVRYFLDKHKDRPERLAAIRNIIQSYIAWTSMRREMEDPSDVINLVTRTGALEFRIAPMSSQAAEFGGARLSASERDKYIKILRDTLGTEGPRGLARRTDRYLWFPICDGRKSGYSRLITVDWDTRKYVLLCNYSGKTLLQRGLDRWSLSNAFMTSDSRKLPAVGFSMDEAGTKLLHDLTQGNMSEHMAILLDGEVYSAPVIQGAISSSGIITMGTFDSHEVSTLIEILRAGVLPARIKSEPISITPFGPATDGDPKAPTTSAD